MRVIVADFEAAVWRAVADDHPHIQMRGCYFHFSQAVWRKVQEIGIEFIFIAMLFFKLFSRFVTLKYLRYICNTIAICCQDHVISRFHYGLACNNARYTHIITRLDRDETYPC